MWVLQAITVKEERQLTIISIYLVNKDIYKATAATIPLVMHCNNPQTLKCINHRTEQIESSIVFVSKWFILTSCYIVDHGVLYRLHGNH